MAPAAEASPSESLEVKTPLTTPKSGQEFLASTSFQIAHDLTATNHAMKSIFKLDYPSHDHYGRTEGAKPPKLAEVMHKDDRYFNDKASETVHSFEYRYLPKPVITDVHKKLSATNFKMDSDLSKFNNLDTMHNSYFTPKVSSDYVPFRPQGSRVSHIPQGDKEKQALPMSDYRERYSGHDTTIHKIEKAPVQHEGGPPTVKGDDRLGHFYTTHNDTFLGRQQNRVHTLPAPVGTHVPGGDPQKVFTTETTMQDSYPLIKGVKFHHYDQSVVSRALGKTNFKQQDGHSVWNDYQSTATVSFKPASASVERFRPSQHRNHSDFPDGDLDPSRVAERVNLTTSRFYHGNPPRGLHNSIISGANRRTKSNVRFAEPPLMKTLYHTTHEEMFRPTSVPYTYNRASFYKDSDIPLDYNKNEHKPTSSSCDYQNPKQKRIMPNPVAIDRLRNSHIFPPLGGRQHFTTTHRKIYTPKEATPVEFTFDPSRMQRSSLPLGTMHMSADF